jgi:hypothetical protein
MNFAKAFELVDSAVFATVGRHLNDPEVTVLRGAWEGLTYDQMAESSQYTINYLMRDVGPKLWKILSECFKEEVSKTNFRAALERHQSSVFVKRTELAPTSTMPMGNGVDEGLPHQDWDEAPDVSVFYGREEELNILEEWLLQEECRLVTLQGKAGIGKTTLSVKLGQQLQEEFDSIVRRSLASISVTAGSIYPVPLQDLLRDLLRFFALKPARDVNQAISLLINYLEQHHCLLILDDVEVILRSEDPLGQYKEGYEEYGTFFRRIGEVGHQSCLLLCSQRKPKDITLLENPKKPIRTLPVLGLKSEDAMLLLKEEGLQEEGCKELVEYAKGNPYALKVAVSYIKKLFNGNVAKFLKEATWILGPYEQELDKQFEALSPLEKDIVFYLNDCEESASFLGIKDNLQKNKSASTSAVMEALASLIDQNLVERQDTETSETLYGIQYITEKYLEKFEGTTSEA